MKKHTATKQAYQLIKKYGHSKNNRKNVEFHIKRAPKNVKKAFIRLYPETLPWWGDNPPRYLAKIAIKKNPSSIEYLKNPSLEVQCIAIKEDADSVYYIQYDAHPKAWELYDNITTFRYKTEEEQLNMLKHPGGYDIQESYNPSETVQLAYMNKGCQIKFLRKPTEKIQIKALQESEYVHETYKWIRNKTEKVKKLYKKFKI